MVLNILKVKTVISLGFCSEYWRKPWPFKLHERSLIDHVFVNLIVVEIAVSSGASFIRQFLSWPVIRSVVDAAFNVLNAIGANRPGLITFSGWVSILKDDHRNRLRARTKPLWVLVRPRVCAHPI